MSGFSLVRRVGAVLALAVGAGALPGCHVRDSFSATFDSPKALAADVLRRLAERDAEGLETLGLSEAEFKSRVWPEMPAQGHVPADYVWDDLRLKSRRSLARSIQRYGGRRFELLDIRFVEGVSVYETFVVHRRAQLLVRDQHGREGGVDVIGSVLEQGGRYKLFSYVVDR